MPNRPTWPWLPFLLLFPAAELRAQLPVQAPGGVLTGIVRDSATGNPVGFALLILVEGDQRVFANESGRFALTGLPSGRAMLRVQQIGYRAITIPLVLDTRGSAAPAPGVVVSLARQAVVLPEIVVRGDECIGEEISSSMSGTILEETFKNAERLLTLEDAYPYRVTWQRSVSTFTAQRVRVEGKVDTVQSDSRRPHVYRRGQVLSKRIVDAQRGILFEREYATYFQTEDLAREEFRKHHCFWFAGPDSVEGFPGYRIEFRPRAKVKTADWAGSLVIDSASMQLMRSEAHLVNLPKVGTTFRGAACTVLYMQLVPTLVHQFQAHCITSQNSRPPMYTVEQWTLIEHAFIGRRPDAPVPP